MNVTSDWLLKAKYALYLILKSENELNFDFESINHLEVSEADTIKHLDFTIKHLLRFNVRKRQDLTLYCEIVENWFITQLLKDKIVSTSNLNELLWTVRLT